MGKDVTEAPVARTGPDGKPPAGGADSCQTPAPRPFGRVRMGLAYFPARGVATGKTGTACTAAGSG